jgi:hypothetical protein
MYCYAVSSAKPHSAYFDSTAKFARFLQVWSTVQGQECLSPVARLA